MRLTWCQQQADIPASAEVGVTIGSGIPWRVIGVPLPGVLTASADVVTTLPGGHETAVFAPSVGWVSPVTEQLTLIGSLGSQWGTEAHMTTFFGVEATPDTGVAAYQPTAGLKNLSLSLIASYQHTERWSTIWLTSVNQYQGDAADSPLVRDTGALNRVFLVWGADAGQLLVDLFRHLALFLDGGGHLVRHFGNAADRAGNLVQRLVRFLHTRDTLFGNMPACVCSRLSFAGF